MYRTRDEYAYHYTTGAVLSSMTIYSSYKRHLNFLTMSQTQYEIFVLLTWFQCIKNLDNFDEFLVNSPPLYVLFIRYIHVYCSLFILKVIGVVMVAIGVILKSALDVGFIKASENAIKIALNAVLKGTYLTNYSIESFSISELFSGISTAMIVIGVLILLLSFFGCCGGCFRVKTMLIIVSLA